MGSIWIGIGNAIFGCLLAWMLLAKRTRTMTHTLKSKTMPEFFEGRFNSTKMKVFAAIIIFVFLVPYSAAVYKGLGSMFTTIFPTVSVNTWMLVIAVLTGDLSCSRRICRNGIHRFCTRYNYDCRSICNGSCYC